MSLTAEARCEAIIGLEIHVQLATRTKMFCGCALAYGAEPNSHVCPVCLGMPGSLPVINERAVELAIRAGLALNCRIAEETRWDRKSYHYPDLPKSYQISQYDLPIAFDGMVEFEVQEVHRRIRIRRAHLEEDAGKNTHDLPGRTLVDLNRAGAPLLEIVTEPDFRSAAEVREFAVQLQRIVRYLGVSEANMQKGQMRFEPNINLRIADGERVAVTPIVEVKNLNSFRALHDAIEFELADQLRRWREDGRTLRPGNKSNRGWDEERGVTVPQREKEEADDYRYFPDPDLTPLPIARERIERLREETPELPIPRTARFIAEYKLPPRDAPALVDDRASADLLDQAKDHGGEPSILGRHFLSFWLMHANARETTIAGLGVSAERMAGLARLQHEGAVNATAAAQIAEAMLTDDSPPDALAQRMGLMQTRDSGAIEAWVEQAIAANVQAVSDARENPKKLAAARGFLVGQVMKLSGGKADPRIVGELLDSRLRRPQ
ncbi:MAG: Asp-tRNA(Asn)/Glu-tRNA(Gln) amidotransferase subunit GatB [Phycisphaerales bacterium]|nr:Asp-tRNA(Asn)/Glu-tRNA(Gln) amidotransferase subunit GatB [Phycisphaerales bacterium]